MLIAIMVRVFTNGPGDRGSISGQVIPKTQKMLNDAVSLSTHHYKVRIKGKVEQPRERIHISESKRRPLGHPLLQSPTLLTTQRCRGGRYSFS